MITFIKLFVVLTLVTCFISYWSDNLGKKLGKKRISFLGFRPRQTATAIGMASSEVILVVTLLVLMLLDRNTRWALTRFDKINKKSQELQQQMPLLLARNQAFEQKNKALQQSASIANANVANLSQRSKVLTQQNGKYLALIAANKGQLQKVQQGETEAIQSAKVARQNEAQARQRVKVEQNHLVETKQQLDHNQQQLGQKQQELTQKKQQLEQINKRLNTLKLAVSELQRAQKVVLVSNKRMLKDNKNLMLQDADLEQELKQKQATVTTLEGQRQTLDAKVSDLQSTVTDLSAKAADWQSKWTRTVGERDELASLVPLANGNILVTVNQVFAAQTIPANSSSSDALKALRQLLADGNDIVKKPPIAGQELRLVPLNIEAQGQRIQLKEDEIINRLADYISTFDVPASVRLVAAYNQVAGETEIGGRMVVVPVRPAVASGDVISAMTIDGSQGDARIFNQLLALVNEGEKAARGHGVMPPQSPGNPDFYAAGTNERIFEALRRIQTIKGPARVRLLAASDLSTAEAAKVRFDVSHFEVSRP